MSYLLRVKRWLKYLIISGFIALNLTIITIDSFPNQNVFDETILDLVGPYRKTLALYQGWSMFAPNPSRENIYVDAEVRFEDGSLEKWGFPRVNHDESGGKMLKERLRKYMQEYLEMKDEEKLWTDLGRFVVRDVEKIEATQGRNRKVASIQFYRHTNIIPRMEKEFRPHGVVALNYDVSPAFYYSPTTGGHYGTQTNL